MKTKLRFLALFVLVPFIVFSQTNFPKPHPGNSGNQKSTEWNISEQSNNNYGKSARQANTPPANINLPEFQKKYFPKAVGTFKSALARQETDSLLSVGRWAYGPCTTVTYQKNTIFYGVGSYLVIADASTPPKPVNVGKVLLPSPAIDIFPYGNFVFIADGSFGLQVIDVTHPDAPAIISSFSLYNHSPAVHVAVSGHYAYLTDYDYVYVIDINDLSHPTESCHFTADDLPGVAGFAIDGNYLFLAAPSGLSIFDITQPLHPRKTGSVGFHTVGETNVVINNKHAYVTIQDSIQVIDVSDKKSPKKISRFYTKGVSNNIWMEGNRIFLAKGWAGAQIIDAGNPDSLFEIASFDSNNKLFSPSFGMAVNKNIIYVSHGAKGLEVVDISNLNALNSLISLTPYNPTKNVIIHGYYAYLLQSQITILDISNPHHPKKVGVFGDKNDFHSAAFYQHYFYDGFGNIYDVNNPVSPVKIGSIDNFNSFSMTISGKRLFVAKGNYGFVIYDLDHPVKPSLLGSYKFAGKFIESVVPDGNYAFVSDGTAVHIMNIKNPAAPFEIALIKKDEIMGMSIDGYYLYITKNTGVYIYDVSHPASPKYVGLIKEYTNQFTVSQHYGLLEGGRGGDKLFIYDLSNPLSPEQTGKFFIGQENSFTKIHVIANMVYLTTYSDGLHILQLRTKNTRFYPVWLGKPRNPMKILIDRLLFANQPVKGGDEVGVFVKGISGEERCVGMKKINYPDSISSVHPLKIIVSQDDPTTKSIDGFISGHQIIFKLWSNNVQQTYRFYNAVFNPAYDSTFSPSDTAELNLFFQSDVIQNSHLDTGWNMVSFYVVPNSVNMYQIMKNLITSGHLIKVIDEKGNFLQYIPHAGWINTIGNMDNSKGYYLKVSTDDSIYTKGPLVRLPATILLRSGWNIMGCPFHLTQPAYNVFKNLILTSDLVKVMNDAGGFIQYLPRTGWLYTFSDLVPGKGYYIRVKNNTALIVGKGMKVSTVSFPSTLNSSHTTSLYYFKKAYKNTPYFPMNIIITGIDLDGYEVHTGDEIAVFDKNTCVGFTTILDANTLPLNIVVSADDPETRIQDGFVPGDSITIRFMSDYLVSPVTMHTSQKFGTENFSPLETFACRISTSAVQLKKHLKSKGYNVQIYPNPALSSTTLNLFCPEKTKVKVDVTNLNGEIVKTVTIQTIPAGDTQFKLNTSGLPAGIYNIRVTLHTNENVTIKNYKLAVVK